MIDLILPEHRVSRIFCLITSVENISLCHCYPLRNLFVEKYFGKEERSPTFLDRGIQTIGLSSSQDSRNPRLAIKT